MTTTLAANAAKTFPLSTLAAALLLGAFSPVAEAADDESRLSTVTVISTGVRGQQRTVADSPAPIDIINSKSVEWRVRSVECRTTNGKVE